PGLVRVLLQRRRRRALLPARWLRVPAEPGLRRAPDEQRPEGLLVPHLRQPGDRDRLTVTAQATAPGARLGRAPGAAFPPEFPGRGGRGRQPATIMNSRAARFVITKYATLVTVDHCGSKPAPQMRITWYTSGLVADPPVVTG